MPDVYFYEAFIEEAEHLQSLLPEGITAGYTHQTIQESGDVQPPARLISVRTQSVLPVDWAPNLAGILSRSTGYDHLSAYAAKVALAKTAITKPESPALGYLPLYCHRAVAEQAMLMWMALLRRLPKQLRQFHTFERDGLTGRECQGRTLAVVGVGHIGHEVCLLGKALGMNVLAVDLVARFDDVQYTDADTALAESDVVVCAMELTPKNHGFFDAARWRRAKRGQVFVNVSRGELSPSSILLQMLNEGQLAGVGLDVYDREAHLAQSLRTDLPSSDAEVQAAIALSQRDDCLCTPHNAFNASEALVRKSRHSVQQIVAFLERGGFLWPVPGIS